MFGELNSNETRKRKTRLAREHHSRGGEQGTAQFKGNTDGKSLEACARSCRSGLLALWPFEILTISACTVVIRIGHKLLEVLEIPPAYCSQRATFGFRASVT